MATATMGLRRRSQIGGSGSSSGSSSSGGKRTRSVENNNSPSQGNLNSPEPAAKKTRSGGACRDTRSSTKAKEQLEQVKKAPPPWSDRSLASIAGLALGGQGGSLQLPESVAALSSPLAFMSSSMATFVGNAAAGLSKGATGVSYLDISNMTARPPGWPTDPTDAAKGSMGLAFPPSATMTAAHFGSSSRKGNNACESTEQQQRNHKGSPAPASPSRPEPLPRNFPNDSMFGAYQPWVIKTYGDLAKTKTITIKKYARILRTLRGEEVNSAENSKFRFWVKSKGFHIGQPEGYDAKPADRIIGRHAVSSPGLDPPLYVPTPPPHNKVSVARCHYSIHCAPCIQVVYRFGYVDLTLYYTMCNIYIHRCMCAIHPSRCGSDAQCNGPSARVNSRVIDAAAAKRLARRNPRTSETKPNGCDRLSLSLALAGPQPVPFPFATAKDGDGR